jgi:hypothetical protein
MSELSNKVLLSCEPYNCSAVYRFDLFYTAVLCTCDIELEERENSKYA